ncbi:MAG: hypothetical protein V7K25_18305 [Nostoc sp.]|uniref:hypothetical protein n=1 Tax=Nostoc sp. TaxID=1180 RepID=UPI002FFBA79C
MAAITTSAENRVLLQNISEEAGQGEGAGGRGREELTKNSFSSRASFGYPNRIEWVSKFVVRTEVLVFLSTKVLTTNYFS